MILTATDHTLLNALNPAQRDAVSAPLGKLLVLAGAGSGKTRVLVHRIAHLIHHYHANPHGILIVSFTNKAAGELRSRTETLLGRSTAGMWVGTFHGLAHRLLRLHWREANLPEHFQILDSDDQYRLIKRLIKASGFDEAKCPPRQMQWYINGQKDQGKRADQLDDHGDLTERLSISVYREYEQLCEKQGLVDFAELLLRSHEVWLTHPDLLQHYQQRFSHILIDEFQDTNTIQYAWIALLTHDQTDLMVVGDDDQSIYGWRGAKVENIHQLQRDFPSINLIRLEQNYRSTQIILEAANTLISFNESRLGKNLWTDVQEGELISLYGAYNERDEAHYIVSQIRLYLTQAYTKNEFAILYRSNAQSRVLEEALLQAGIAYRVYGGMRFFERAEIKTALAYLRLAVNRQDDDAFERIINMPTRGIGEKSVTHIRDIAKTRDLSLWQAARCIIEEKQLTARANNALTQFVETMERINAGLIDTSLSEQVEHALVISGLLAFYRKEKSESALARVENLEELISAAKQFQLDPEHTEQPLLAFLATAALEAGDLQDDDSDDCVQLMTLHSAKGLEFPIVFLAGLEEGLFPHFMSSQDPMRLEEERRLCYVGMTRAKTQLCLSYAESRRQRGSETLQRPSRFLKEIPSHCIQEVRPRAHVSRPMNTYRQFLTDKSDPIMDDNQTLRIGQQVKHKKFGQGTILAVEGNGQSLRVQVRFCNGDRKWLVAAFAKLEVV